MAPKNPLGKITETAVSLPLKATEKVADKAVGVVAGGVRVAAGLIYSTTERAKSAVGLSEPEEKQKTPPRATTPASTASVESAEEAAAAAVAREMEQEPVPSPTPSKAARQTAPAKRKPAAKKTPAKPAAKPAGAAEPTEPASEVVFTSESSTTGQVGTTESDLPPSDTEPLLDPSVVKAVKSESEVLRKAADLDKG